MKTSSTRGSAAFGRTVSMLVGVLLSAASAHAADGTWTNWAGGAWGTASSWQGLTIPDAGTANLTGSGGSYVARYEAISPAIKNLNVWNVAPKTTELRISSKLTHVGGSALRIGTGARVAITNNGVWTYAGINDTTDKGESMFSIKNGGEVLVCGGSVTFTNIPRSSTSWGNSVNVGYQSAGTLNVASGRFDLWERSATPNVTHTLVVGRDTGGVGTMNLSGGTVVLGIQTASGGDNAMIVGSNGGRGTLTVSGGTLLNTNTVWNAFYVGYNGGQGTLVVTNSGVVTANNDRLYVGAFNRGNGVARFAGGTSTFSLAYVGYMKDAAGSSTGKVEVTAGTLTATGDLTVGHGESGTDRFGRGQLEIGGGSTTCGITSGMAVGYGKSGGTGTGFLTVTGGAMRVNAGYNWGSGLIVGHIPENDNNAATRATGSATISGGAITNNGMVIVGFNGATGTVMQTGGSVVLLNSVANLTAIGYGRGASSYFKGGYGTYTMQGGTYLTRNRTFVGGVPTSVVSDANNASVGLLKVTGGTFTCSNTLYVAANGTGTLTVGNGGRVVCDDLQIANSTSGTMRFKVLRSWSGLVKVKNTVTVAAGAKLVIDLTDYVPAAVTAVHLLLDASARSGSFAPGDITWINPSGRLAVLEQLSDGDLRLTVRDPRGTVILIR
jgi:T5SS/PEP-CTERM-associated repeat protein